MTALQDLPEGKKFFPYSVENPSEGILKTFSQVFSSEYRDAMEKVSSISTLGTMYQGMDPLTFNSFLNGFKTHGPSDIEGYPILECVYMNLNNHVVHTTTRQSHVLKHMGCIDRMPEFSDMPCFIGMLLSYDPVRQGFMLHNAPYEGEFIKTKKYPEANKMIKTSIEDSLAEVAMYRVLGENMKISDTYSHYQYNSTKEKTKNIVDNMITFLEGESSWEVTWKLALDLGIASSERVYHTDPQGRSKGVYLKIKEGAKVKIPAIARRHLMIHLGAYELPEDYMNYFN